MRARQKAKGCAVVLGGMLLGMRGTLALAATADPFNPSSFVQAEAAADRGDELRTRGVYRINGHRYLEFTSAAGSVFLPSFGEGPDLLAATAICPTHLALQREVLPLRRGLPMDAASKRLATPILSLIHACLHGAVTSPVVLERQPDGAVIERRAPAP